MRLRVLKSEWEDTLCLRHHRWIYNSYQNCWDVCEHFDANKGIETMDNHLIPSISLDLWMGHNDTVEQQQDKAPPPPNGQVEIRGDQMQAMVENAVMQQANSCCPVPNIQEPALGVDLLSSSDEVDIDSYL